MRNKSILTTLLLFAAWHLFVGTMRDPNNPPVSRTGAPGETTCVTAGCHNGGSFNGTVVLNGLPDTIVASQAYNITLIHASNAVRAGFQLTCLDSVNKKCGVLKAGAGTSLGNNNTMGRQYVRQSSPKNLVNGSTSWTFTWTAPAEATGNKAFFYFASLAANGNGNNNGDNALVGRDTAVLVSPSVATGEPVSVAAWVNVYPTVVRGTLNVRLLDADGGLLEILNSEGQLLQRVALTNRENAVSVGQLPKGVFVARVQAAKRNGAFRFVVP